MKKVVALSILILSALGSAAFAAVSDSLVTVDGNSVLRSHPKYEAAVRKIQGISDPKQIADEEQKLLNPIFEDCDQAIAEVCKAYKATVAMEKSVVYYGGWDITPDVKYYLEFGRCKDIEATPEQLKIRDIYFVKMQDFISRHPKYEAAARQIRDISDPKRRADEWQKLIDTIIKDFIDVNSSRGGFEKEGIVITEGTMLYFGGVDFSLLMDEGRLSSLSLGTGPIATIDPQKVLFQHPKYEAVMRQLRGISDPKQRADEEWKLDFIYKDIDLAVRAVSNAKGAQAVYDEKVFFYGGLDITDAVIKELKSGKEVYRW